MHAHQLLLRGEYPKTHEQHQGVSGISEWQTSWVSAVHIWWLALRKKGSGVVFSATATSVVVVVASPKSAAQRAGSVASRRHEVDV